MIASASIPEAWGRRVGECDSPIVSFEDAAACKAGLCIEKYGAMAEWSCRGLQILVRRFDSGSRLQDVTRGEPSYASARLSEERRDQRVCAGCHRRQETREPRLIVPQQ